MLDDEFFLRLVQYMLLECNAANLYMQASIFYKSENVGDLYTISRHLSQDAIQVTLKLYNILKNEFKAPIINQFETSAEVDSVFMKKYTNELFTNICKRASILLTIDDSARRLLQPRALLLSKKLNQVHKDEMNDFLLLYKSVNVSNERDARMPDIIKNNYSLYRVIN